LKQKREIFLIQQFFSRNYLTNHQSVSYVLATHPSTLSNEGNIQR